MPDCGSICHRSRRLCLALLDVMPGEANAEQRQIGRHMVRNELIIVSLAQMNWRGSKLLCSPCSQGAFSTPRAKLSICDEKIPKSDSFYRFQPHFARKSDITTLALSLFLKNRGIVTVFCHYGAFLSSIMIITTPKGIRKGRKCRKIVTF